MYDLRYPYVTSSWPYIPLNNFPQQGWICPRCGTVWSPSMIMCTCKRGEITSGSTMGTLEEMAADPDIQAEMKAIDEEFRPTEMDGLE